VVDFNEKQIKAFYNGFRNIFLIENPIAKALGRIIVNFTFQK
jgi:hypothetical protein